MSNLLQIRFSMDFYRFLEFNISCFVTDYGVVLVLDPDGALARSDTSG